MSTVTKKLHRFLCEKCGYEAFVAYDVHEKMTKKLIKYSPLISPNPHCPNCRENVWDVTNRQLDEIKNEGIDYYLNVVETE